MSRYAVIGALALLASACNKPAETTTATGTGTTTGTGIATGTATTTTTATPITSIGEAMAKFDPSKQHIVWVLPEGIKGAGPWEMDIRVKHRGEVKYQSKIPLNAEIMPGGTRPEFPAGTEVVKLSGDERYGVEMAEVGKVVEDLIAQHGRGDGELEVFSELKTKIAPEYRKAYCVDGKKPVVLSFIEQGDPPALEPLDLGPMAPMFDAAILKDCKT